MIRATQWPSTRAAWGMTLALTFAYAIGFLHRIGISLFVEPMRADLALSDTAIGLITGACFAIPYTLSAPFMGWLVDRFHRLRLIAVCALIWSAGTAFGVFSYMSIVVGRIVTGAAQSIVQPGSTSLIADMFPPERRATGYGVFVAGTALGTSGAYFAAAAAVAVGSLMAGPLGVADWQAAMMLLGGLGLLTPILLTGFREPVRQELSEEPVSHGAAVRFVLRRGWVFAALFGGVAFAFAAMYGQLAFMPALFMRKYAWAAQDVALVFGAIAGVVGVFGSVSVGWVTDWLTRRGFAHASWLVCLWGSLACLVPGALAPLMPDGKWCMALFALSGVFANYPAVAVLAAIADITPNELRGRMTALYTALVGLVSATFGPLAVGSLNDFWPGGSAIDLALSATFAGSAAGSFLLLGGAYPAFRRLTRAVTDGC